MFNFSDRSLTSIYLTREWPLETEPGSMLEHLHSHLFPQEPVHLGRFLVGVLGVPAPDVEEGVFSVVDHGAPYERDLHVRVVRKEASVGGGDGEDVHGPVVEQADAGTALG